jgi:hypothetical protein
MIKEGIKYRIRLFAKGTRQAKSVHYKKHSKKSKTLICILVKFLHQPTLFKFFSKQYVLHQYFLKHDDL